MEATPNQKTKGKLLELRQLRHFLAVVDGGSLGDAARHLRVSQPSLTKSIQALERSVGGALFERSVQGMRPTALGRGLEARARVIAGEVGRAEREINELLDGQRGKVAIGTGPSFAHAILPLALARFHRKHPGIEVKVIDGLLRDALPLVKTGEIDYAFYGMPKSLADDDLAQEVLMSGQEISIVTAASNPIAAKPRLSPRELWCQPWALPTPPDYIREMLETRFQELGLPPLRPVIELSSISAAKSILRGTNFITIFMKLLVEDDLKRKDLCQLHVAEMGWTANFSAIYRRDVPLPPAAKKLLDEIRTVCTER
jgi:LysR family transcriptional regulator of abg operon